MTSSPDVFAGSRLKIKRANEHIDELNDVLNNFVKTDFYTLRVEKDPSTGLHVLHLGMKQPAPDCLPLIIGDAFHNLRTALDFMASSIVRSANGPGKYIKFPFRDTRKEVESALKNGEMKVAKPSVIGAILDTVKPYRGGNDALCALHDLDVTDKHLLLIPIVSVTALTHVSATTSGGATFEDCEFAVRSGGEAGIVGAPGDFEFQDYGQPVFSVVFDKGQPFEGQSVVPTLHQLAQLVSGVVQTIEKAFLAP